MKIFSVFRYNNYSLVKFFFVSRIVDFAIIITHNVNKIQIQEVRFL